MVKAWGHILRGIAPAVSIEITRECPLRCPGCYAYNDAHLGGGTNLRQLADRKGQALIDGIMEVVDRLNPLHISLVGGDPLVRYRELESILPALLNRGIHVQLVTSAFRPIPAHWAAWQNLTVAVSIDGLAPDHDVRRAPATYDRIVRNIVGGRITVHCTITGQMRRKQPGYLAEFLDFWTPRQEVSRVWFSVFTPQRGEPSPEVLTRAERLSLISELQELRVRYPKLNLGPAVIRELANPPQSPDECIFAKTTETISADLTTRITPCQFGGDPDCSQCGCMASMGLAAVGHYKLGGIVPLGKIFEASVKIGSLVSGRNGRKPERKSAAVLPVLR